MATIVTRSGKGSPLTHVEVDANFTNLNNDKLDVAGIAAGSAASPTLKFTGDGNTGIYSPGADQVAISTNGTGRLFVGASGQIGITQSSLSSGGFSGGTLKIGHAPGQTAGILLQNNSTNTDSSFWYTDGTGSYLGSNNGFFAHFAGGSERLRITSAGQLSHIGAGSDASPAVSFNGSAPSNSLVVDSLGRVSIGTSSPLTTLHLNANNSGGIGSKIRLANFATRAAGNATRIEFANNSDYNNGSAVGAYIDAINPTGTVINETVLTFGTGTGGSPSERVRIDETGRVGIGTNAPTHLLSVGIGGSGGSTYPIALGQTAGVPSARIDGYKVDGSYAGELHLYTATGAGAQNRAVTIDSSQRVGIGTTSPGYSLDVWPTGLGLARIGSQDSQAGLYISSGSAASPFVNFLTSTSTLRATIYTGATSDDLIFGTGASGTERFRIDSVGRLLVGAPSTSSNTTLLLQGFNGTLTNSGAHLRLAIPTATPGDGFNLGLVLFSDSEHTNCAIIRADREGGTWNSTSKPTCLKFSTTADGAISPTERMRITNNGLIKGGSITVNPGVLNTAVGFEFSGDGYGIFSRSSNAGLIVSRTTDDGSLVDFWQDGNIEGNIAISGTTVSYNGAHLSRWSQLPSGAERTEILRGTVLSNIDEMCEWGEEDNEQLNRMKVSDVESDANVAGVFQAWDDDDDTYTNDFYCAMTGDFIIRIGAGVSVQRGDLLMSAGDGTAKPQGDDIVRSKTVAKVTSTNVSCTYPDGSYCVPCVLMAC